MAAPVTQVALELLGQLVARHAGLGQGILVTFREAVLQLRDVLGQVFVFVQQRAQVLDLRGGLALQLVQRCLLYTSPSPRDRG